MSVYCVIPVAVNWDYIAPQTGLTGARTGWAVNNGHIVSNGSSLITETTPGTYTFTLTCTGGGQTSSSSTTIVVTPNPGVISLTAVMPEQQVGTFNVLNLLWNGTGGGCVIDYVTNSGQNEAGEARVARDTRGLGRAVGELDGRSRKAGLESIFQRGGKIQRRGLITDPWRNQIVRQNQNIHSDCSGPFHVSAGLPDR